MPLNINYTTYNKKLFFKNAYELKLRFYYFLLTLIITISICYIYSDAIIYMFVNPLLIKMNSQRFIFTSLKEIFFMYLKFSFLLGLLFSFPIFILQLLLFLSNGLYKYEIKIILFFLIFSGLLFIIGFLLGYKIIIPNAWNFFLEFENKNIFFPLHFEAKLNTYIFFILNLLLGIIICFQIPAFLFIFFSFNFFKSFQFLKNRKLIYILSCFAGTLISSPDIFSQLFILFMFITIYEISLFFLFFFNKIKL
tara:strand:+ start:31597 stop:32349 length:753 start_codon:yes stop_codon:yes gene_type:complete